MAESPATEPGARSVTHPPSATTAVIGAGPAGLLFTLAARIRYLRAGAEPSQWALVLFDKRADYRRTHRLRIDPAPYLRLGDELEHPLYARFIAFLEAEQFTPAVNRLEEALLESVSELGIEREMLTIGAEPGTLGLVDVRRKLELEGRLAPDSELRLVAADSVHSATRGLVASDAERIRHTHQTVARLVVRGPGLPERMPRLEQYKLAKLLGSVLDYRLNANGFGEVDLFLQREEHAAVADLGALPAAPIALSEEVLDRLDAPLFVGLTRQLVRGLGSGPCTIELFSTFALEHAYQRCLTYPVPEANATVSLVGDAAISLPYFRGMAGLAAHVRILSDIEARHAAGERPDPGAYDAQAARIRERELAVVARRDRSLRIAREFVALSAAVPFPIQNRLLSIRPADSDPGGMSPGVAFNAIAALAAGLIVMAAVLLGTFVDPPLGWVWLLAVPVQAAGGFAFEAARTLEPSPNRWLQNVWRIQLALLLVLGLPLTLLSSWELGRPAQLYAVVAWFALGVVFAAGMYVFRAVWPDDGE